ncbi:hypothetical protein TanjilG_28774 [Lupinus angustifolius]|uniref:Uncharacterized protein n=1 Tax=Lupinus angustifolius TaxID=3871 RepID=A0A394D9G1_LUPAN|nr:hypothetical protein TanjilG_28774 [Lupinus angustifolius]
MAITQTDQTVLGPHRTASNSKYIFLITNKFTLKWPQSQESRPHFNKTRVKHMPTSL